MKLYKYRICLKTTHKWIIVYIGPRFRSASDCLQPRPWKRSEDIYIIMLINLSVDTQHRETKSEYRLDQHTPMSIKSILCY